MNFLSCFGLIVFLPLLCKTFYDFVHPYDSTFFCSHTDAGKLFMVESIPKLIKDPSILSLRSFTQVCR